MNLPYWKMAKLLNMSRSGLYKFKNRIQNNKNEIIKIEENNNIDEGIIEAFNKNCRVFGRKRLSEYIRINYGILINYRTLGKKMQKLGLFVKLVKKEKREKRKIQLLNSKTLLQEIIMMKAI